MESRDYNRAIQSFEDVRLTPGSSEQRPLIIELVYPTTS